MGQIPEHFTDFLYWVKDTTESFWSNPPAKAQELGWVKDWQKGAKWIGMQEEEINSMEKKYSISFLPEHREFLKILHTLDRKEIQTWEDWDGTPHTESRSFFYNWREDTEQIKARLRWPYETLLHDVLRADHPFWPKAWGKMPENMEERKEQFDALFSQSPPLYPILGHRFLVSTPEARPVISIIGSDTVIYGWNFRHYLIAEIGGYLIAPPIVYDEKEEEYNALYSAGMDSIRIGEWEKNRTRQIPFWSNIIR